MTVSWYRGPLTPYPVPFTVLPGPLLPAGSADALTRYDSDTGMFDVSLAAAWQIGRLMALADRQFATELYAFKRVRRQQLSRELGGLARARAGRWWRRRFTRCGARRVAAREPPAV